MKLEEFKKRFSKENIQKQSMRDSFKSFTKLLYEDKCLFIENSQVNLGKVALGYDENQEMFFVRGVKNPFTDELIAIYGKKEKGKAFYGELNINENATEPEDCFDLKVIFSEKNEQKKAKKIRDSILESLKYNKFGFDKNGKHKNGTLYDDEGYDIEGYDVEGYNLKGFNIKGIHKNGTLYDNCGYDIEGYDRNGFDKKGYDKEGYSRIGFSNSGLYKEGGLVNKFGHYSWEYDSSGNYIGVPKQIQTLKYIIDKRGIKNLLHVTHIDNLESILQYGILPIEYIKNTGVRVCVSDDGRNDGRTDSTSLSIESINWRYFKNLEDYVCITLDPSILFEKNIRYYCPYNAASYGIKIQTSRGMLTDVKSFEKMFDNKIVREYSDPTRGKELTIRDKSLDDKYTTDIQAEILFTGEIPVRFFKSIIVNDMNKISRSIINKCNNHKIKIFEGQMPRRI